MVSSVYWEWSLLIESLKLGIKMGLIYDAFRLLRVLFSHHKFIIDVEDIVYWIICTYLIFRLQLNLADGITRGFVIVTVFVGMGLYHMVFARWWISPVRKWVNKLKQWLTRAKEKFRMKKNTTDGREEMYGEKKNSYSKKKAKQPGDGSCNHDSTCNDDRGSSK